MKKVIIIDDRPERRKLHLDEASIKELEKLRTSGCLTVSVAINGDFSDFFKEYDIIAVHRTYLANEGLYNSLLKYATSNKKPLIIFSGGISQNIIREQGNLLIINAGDFYNAELPCFINNFCNNESCQSPLLQLLYGKAWRLTLLLQYRHLLWTYEDIDEIDDEDDDNAAESLQKILWNGDCSISIEDVNKEIEIEKHNRVYQ